MDRPFVAGLHEQRQQAAVVEMGVGQEDGVELGRVEGERDPVADRLVRAALEHPAVDEDLSALRGQQELRPGDGRGAAEELDVHARHGDSAAGRTRILRAHGPCGRRASVWRAARGLRRPRRRRDPWRTGRSIGVDPRAAPAPPNATPGVEAALAALRRADVVGEDDTRAVSVMRGVLPWFDEVEPPPRGSAASASDAEARRRIALYRRYGEAATSIRFGGETLDRLTVLGRLGTEPDPKAREALFRSMEPMWRAVDGDGGDRSPFQRLVGPAAERWATAGSPIAANARSVGLEPGAFEGILHELLNAWRELIGVRRIEPWDHWYACGAASRRLDRHIPQSRLLELNHAYVRSLGADPERLGIAYDVVPRPGRPPVPAAFTMGMGALAAGQPRQGSLDATPAVGLRDLRHRRTGNLVELLHETGHALHAAATRTRPAFLELPNEDTGYGEGIADFLGWDATEPRGSGAGWARPPNRRRPCSTGMGP
jgi:hypothetical protein